MHVPARTWIGTLILLLSGCRLATVPMVESSLDTPREPRAAMSSRVTQLADEDWRPLLDRLNVLVAGPHLVVHGQLSEHAPVPFNDDWSLQMLLDTDQNDETGVYQGGYDYVVRGPERLADGSLIVRITTGGGGPGGWGAEVGTAHFVENLRTFHIRVPLHILKDDDGGVDWRLETYFGPRLRFLESFSGSSWPRQGRQKITMSIR